MKRPDYIRLLPIVAVLVFVQCKNQEKVAEQPSIAESPCIQLTQNLSDDDLAFVAEAESDNEDIASQKARKQAVIDLVQFFQSAYIDESQEIFGSSVQPGGWNEFRKQWAETSFEMIGELHNRQAFINKKIVTQDSAGTFRAVNVLTVTKDWIFNHWQETLKATDPAVHNTASKKDINPVRELEKQKAHPCKNNS